MSFRSFFVILCFSLGCFGSVFSMTKANKFSRNGQTVYILEHQFDQEASEKETRELQFSVLLKALNDLPWVKQRKVQLLCERPSGREEFPPLDNQNIIVHNIENSVKCSNAAYLLSCNPFFLNLLCRLNVEEHNKFKDLTFKDLFEELEGYVRELQEDIPNIPTDAEKGFCKEQVSYCQREIDFLRKEVVRIKWPMEKPLMELKEKMGPVDCESLAEEILWRKHCFIDSVIARRILKSNPDEDIVVITQPDHTNGIWQYLDSAQWSRDIYYGYSERLLSPEELDSFLRHLRISERVKLQLNALNAYTYQTASIVYNKLISYLKK